MTDAYETVWSLEGAAQHIFDAALDAGIDGNAVSIVQDFGHLDYPSFFCRDRHEWVKALAYLVVRRLEVSIYLCRRVTDESRREVSRFRLHPRMDEATVALMASIDTAETVDLRRMEDRVEAVIDALMREADAARTIDDL